MRIAREEVFGPVVSLIEFESFEEAIQIANSIDYGLSTALYTKDVNRAFAAIRDLESGITYINAPTIGAEVHLPFGGVKHTGNGHREGLSLIHIFTFPSGRLMLPVPAARPEGGAQNRKARR